MLDEVAPARPPGCDAGQELSHHIELVVAGEDRVALHLASLRILPFDILGVVLKNVGEPYGREDELPEVVGLEPIRVGRVSGAVVEAQVEGQEPGRLALEGRTEADLVVVDGEVRDTAPQLEELLPRIAVAAVLLDGVVDCLLGQAVLDLEGEDRQAVDEEAEIEGQRGLVAAIAELSGDAEAVGAETLLGRGVSGARGAAEERDVVGTWFDRSSRGR